MYHTEGLIFNNEPATNFTPEIRTNFIPLNMASVNDINKILNEMIINKKQDVLIDILKQIDNKIKNITSGPKLIYADIEGLDQLIPINLSGDGIRKLVTLLLAIYDSRGGVLVIDEIENGLHYTTIKTLWNAILKMAELYKVQIFATTHNLETLKYLNECLHCEENIGFQSKVRAFSLKRLDNMEHKAYCYEFREFESALEEKIEIR